MAINLTVPIHIDNPNDFRYSSSVSSFASASFAPNVPRTWLNSSCVSAPLPSASKALVSFLVHKFRLREKDKITIN